MRLERVHEFLPLVGRRRAAGPNDRRTEPFKFTVRDDPRLEDEIASASNPSAIILPQALGASICGVITSAIIAGTFVALLR